MELCLCDITFHTGYADPIDLNIFQSLINISAMNYATNFHHFLRHFNNECSSMCVSIGFNESFDDGKDKSCVFVKEF